MFLFLSSLLVTGVVFISMFLIFNFNRKNTSSPKLPPGKLGWPIIGESLEFISSCRRGCPEKFVSDRMNKHSPEVFKTSILGENMVVLCGPSGNKLMISSENKLVRSWWPSSFEKILFSRRSFASVSTRLRHKILKLLKPELLQKYVPIIQCMADHQLEIEWIPKSKVKVFPLSKKLTFSVACRLFFGLVDPEQVAKLADPFSDVLKGLFSVPIDFPGTAFNGGMKAANCIRNQLFPIIRERRSQQISEATGDLLSQLLLETDEDGKFLSEMEIADQFIALLTASHDSTSCVITFVIYYLSDHPDIYARVLKEQMEIANSKGTKELLNWEDIQQMKYSRNVVNEVMRVASPSLGNFREVIADFTYGGCTVPKGWKIFSSTHATHKNPEYFPNPEKFDPSRFEGNGAMPFTFVPFGGGPRMCPGSEFARVQILIFMHCLVVKFKWEKLVPDENITYDPIPVPVKGLPIPLLPHGD